MRVDAHGTLPFEVTVTCAVPDSNPVPVACLFTQALQIHEKVKARELDYKQGARLMALSGSGAARTCHSLLSSTVYVARRRKARKLGYSANGVGVPALDVELDVLLGPYKRAVRGRPVT